MSKRNKAADRAARAAALRAEQERKERQRRLLTIGGVVAGLLVIVLVAVWLQMRAGEPEEGPSPASATSSFGLRLGEAGADHEVVIYEDFLCPACKSFEDESVAELDSAVADGRATVEYRPLDFLTRFGDYSLRSANAFAVVLDTAGPEVAKEFHDILYAEQPPESGPFPDDEWLIEKAVEAGATEAEVQGGVEDLEFEAWVGNGVKAATAAGIQGTPTVIVDGEAIDAGALTEALE